MSESKKMPDFAFKIMSMVHNNPLQWFLRNPYRLLKMAGVKSGRKVLEVGCGPGFFTIPASEIVGEKGVVYALDNHPLAIKSIQKKINEEGIENVKPILADATKTGLPDESIDVEFLFGFVHHTRGLRNIFLELYHVLKPDGLLSIEKTPWLSGKRLIAAAEANKFVYLSHRGKIFSFTKKKQRRE